MQKSKCLIGIKELFCGYVVKVWTVVDMSSNKHRKLNKIVVRKCIEFYIICWKYRNETYRDTEKQKEHVKR